MKDLVSDLAATNKNPTCRHLYRSASGSCPSHILLIVVMEAL
jgi:hypothetical protein